MAYIQPNSTVLLLHGVSLDKSYNHTIYWSDIGVQSAQLASYVKTTPRVMRFEKQTYQRVNRNTIRLQVLADDIYDCNYIMFQNTSYGNKWFYAFIDEVNYVNDKATEIVYTIDVMQTWYFDYELGMCFVEREHTLTDVAGENIVDEGLNGGEMIYNEEKSIPFSGAYMGGFITTKNITGLTSLNNLEAPTDNTSAPCGVSSGLYIYAGLPVDDVADQMYRSNPTAYVSSANGAYDIFTNVSGFSYIIDQIVKGRVEGVDEDAIVATFQYPIEFSLRSYINVGQSLGFYTFTSSGTLTLERPNAFKGLTTPQYTPKNNKLYTYPYMKCVCTTQQGAIAEYKFEDFSTSIELKTAGIRWVGTLFPAPQLYAFPTDYKGIARCYDEGVAITNMPVPAWKGDRYAQWLNQQSFSTGAGLFSAALTAALGLASSNPVALAASGVSLVSAISGVVGKALDLSRTPPAAYLQSSNNTLMSATKQITIKLQSQTIKAERAKVIDDYFSMFGYAVHEVKMPNIRSAPLSSLRPNWNYIKTQGCVIHPNKSQNKGLPADAEAQIARIYDNGITFWVSDTNIGDYSLDNTARG